MRKGWSLGGGDYTGDRIILCRPATQASGGLWVHTSCTIGTARTVGREDCSKVCAVYCLPLLAVRTKAGRREP